jgi:hypothetical protein
MKQMIAGLAMLAALVTSPGSAHADVCSVDGCSISCPKGCGATIVNGKCVKGCADDQGNLHNHFWEQLDQATGDRGSAQLCVKGVKQARQTRGASACK